MMDWESLWEIATDVPDGQGHAIIHLSEDPTEVVLEFEDGSKTGLYWHEGAWRFAEGLDTCPCDVAARDSF